MFNRCALEFVRSTTVTIVTATDGGVVEHAGRRRNTALDPGTYTLSTVVMHANNETIWSTENARVVRFRCPPSDARFRENTAAESYVVAFPRSAVWIHRPGERPFVADPAIAMLLNPGQMYLRTLLHDEGECTDRFEVSQSVAHDIVASIDPRAADSTSLLFRASMASVNNELYVRQRSLFRRLQARVVYDLDAEEAVIGIVTEVIAQSMNVRHAERQPARAFTTHCDLVEQAKCELNRLATLRVALTDLSRTLGVSPFHLCRVFKSRTGQTLHQYQLTVRLRMALERLGESDGDLSRMAQELGFANHSHFTNAVRRRFGATPSALRHILRGRQVNRATPAEWLTASRSMHRLRDQAVGSA